MMTVRFDERQAGDFHFFLAEGAVLHLATNSVCLRQHDQDQLEWIRILII